MEKPSFFAALLCLCSVSKDAAALGLYQTPPCISAAVGTAPIMECRFPPMEASGIAFVSWYKKGETLNSSDSRLLQSENLTAGFGSLRISGVQALDAGVFVCEVGNITHSASGNGTKLEVHVSKDAAALGLYQTPPCISAAVGTAPIMECRFPPMEASGIAFVSWYKEGETLNSSDSRLLQSENLTAGFGSLRISGVQALDAGVFVCEVGNITHSASGNGTKLEVHGSTPLMNQSAIEGCVRVTTLQEEKKVATSVGINVLLVRNILGVLLLLTLVLAVIIVNSMSGYVTRLTGRIRRRKGTGSNCFT